MKKAKSMEQDGWKEIFPEDMGNYVLDDMRYSDIKRIFSEVIWKKYYIKGNRFAWLDIRNGRNRGQTRITFTGGSKIAP